MNSVMNDPFVPCGATRGGGNDETSDPVTLRNVDTTLRHNYRQTTAATSLPHQLYLQGGRGVISSIPLSPSLPNSPRPAENDARGSAPRGNRRNTKCQRPRGTSDKCQTRRRKNGGIKKRKAVISPLCRPPERHARARAHARVARLHRRVNLDTPHATTLILPNKAAIRAYSVPSARTTPER